MRMFFAVVLFYCYANSVFAEHDKTPQFLNDAHQHKKSFSRIVSLAPVITETLFALGAEKKIVGVTRFCDRPAAALQKTRVGGYVDGSLERILGLQPDLVIAMPQQAQQSLLSNIQKHGVPVYLVFGDTISEIKQLIHGLGSVLKAEKAAKRLTQELQKSYNDFHNVLSRHKGTIVVLAGVQPLVMAGPKTFIHESLSHMGLTPLPQGDAPLWPVWAMEHLVATQPDWVLFLNPGPGVLELKQRLQQHCPKGCQGIVFETPIFQRPGIYLHEDLKRLQHFFATPKRTSHEP